MDTQISELSDGAAIGILARFPEARPIPGAAATQISNEEKEALIEEFEITSSATPVSEGELARQTLLLLAEDPEKLKVIHTMADNLPQSGQRFDAGLSIAVATAALLVLQTYVHAKRDKDGKWTFEIKKQPTDKTLLKLLVQKLIPSLPSK